MSFIYHTLLVFVILFGLTNLIACSQKQAPAPVVSQVRPQLKPKTQRIFQKKPKKIGYHLVKQGDTLYSIGLGSGHGYKALAAWNNIREPYKIYRGQYIKLFKFKQSHSIQKPRKKHFTKKSYSSQKKPVISNNNTSMLKSYWRLPMKGKTIKTYWQSGKKGIDIAGNHGQIVTAAATGKVVYSGDGVLGYNNLVIIKHNELYLSAYSNNRKLLVTEGQYIKQGQAIAEIGIESNKPAFLHFEIRKNGKSVNPSRYLPKK